NRKMQGVRQCWRIADGNEHPSFVRNRLRYGARRGADHRKTMCERLRIGHPVSLEIRCKDEQVGAAIERRELLRRHGSKKSYPVWQSVTCDFRTKFCSSNRITRKITGNRQSPRKSSKGRKRRDQDVKSFAWYDGADR